MSPVALHTCVNKEMSYQTQVVMDKKDLNTANACA